MADKTIKAREARLRAANASKGFVQVRVWIPADKREELHRLANKWRVKACGE